MTDFDIKRKPYSTFRRIDLLLYDLEKGQILYGFPLPLCYPEHKNMAERIFPTYAAISTQDNRILVEEISKEVLTSLPSVDTKERIASTMYINPIIDKLIQGNFGPGA